MGYKKSLRKKYKIIVSDRWWWFESIVQWMNSIDGWMDWWLVALQCDAAAADDDHGWWCKQCQ